jgi:hypothetical protein
MKTSYLAIPAGAVITAFSTSILAREIPFDYSHCFHGETFAIAHAENFVVGTLKAYGPLRSNIPNSALDEMSTQCVGSFQVIDGKFDATGWCELIDRDGDKIIGDWTDGSSRTWKIRNGSGKFKGITAERTTFEPMAQFKAPSADMFQGCNRTKGVYNLP